MLPLLETTAVKGADAPMVVLSGDKPLIDAASTLGDEFLGARWAPSTGLDVSARCGAATL